MHTVQLMLLHPKTARPHRLLPHLNPDWFYLSVTGLLRLSWERGNDQILGGLVSCGCVVSNEHNLSNCAESISRWLM